jgi:Dolichyl-phosphate-mannose-protein mannosyltransferase
MPPRPARWLSVLPCLGLMAATTTLFQLTLPRLRKDWIVNAISDHNLVMAGTAGSPWQYRVLSDYLIEAVFKVVAAAQNRTPYLYGLTGFLLFRGAQELCIFGLGFVYFRKLGLGVMRSVVGLAVVCTAMVVGQIQTNWQLDAYTELILYLLAAIFVLSRRWALVVPVAVLAALNRETGVFIPLMPLALMNVRAPRSLQNLVIYRTVSISLVLFVLIRVVLFFALPSQDTSTRLIPEDLVSSIKMEGPFVYVAIALGTLPFVGALGLPTGSPFLRYLFWLIIPVWMVTHAWGNMVMAPIPFLVPLALVIVPSALFGAAALLQKTEWGSMLANSEIVAALAVVYLLGAIVAGVVRLNYPFPLERIEGSMLQEVRRVALGQPLYVAPSLAYVPLLYGPVYVYVSAGVATLTGVSLLPLRLVSLAATLGSAILVYLLVWREAPGRLAGLLAAGLFIGTTQLTPTDRYPARVDALCLLLVMAAIWTARRADRQPNVAPQLSVLCGLLVGLAILTKQTAVVVALSLLVVGMPRIWARVVPYVVAAGATLAAAIVALMASTDGWARFYLVDLPRNHGLEWTTIAAVWTQYLLPHVGVAVLLALAFFVVRARRGDYGAVRFYALAAGGLIGMSWVGVLNPGGGANSLPPAYAGVAMLFGLGFQASLDLWRVRFPLSRGLSIGVFVAAALALANVQYSGDQPAPLHANARAGERLVAAIAALPGPVFAPDLEEFQVDAGKGDHASAAGLQELLGSYGGTELPEGRQFLDALDQALSSRQYAYVLYDTEGMDLALKDMLSFHGYEIVGPLLDKDDPFFLWRRGFSSGGGYLTPAPILYAPRAGAR